MKYLERASHEYRHRILRSWLCLDQILQRSSGGDYPAITEDELLKIKIPLSSSDPQEKIVAEHSRHRPEARRLRAEASAE